ncbi:hypothetical protein [Flavobacterium sp.]
MKFSLDGIPYYKNFIGVVKGNKLQVVNVYDSKLCLTEFEEYTDYTVNGVVHGSVAALQNALLPILFTRNNLGGVPGNQTPNYQTFTFAGGAQTFDLGIVPVVMSVVINEGRILKQGTEWTEVGGVVTVIYELQAGDSIYITSLEN